MSIAAIDWSIRVRVGDSLAKLMLMAIANYADEHGKAWPSAGRLAEDCECSVPTARRRIKYLEDAGLVTTRQQWVDEAGRRNDEGRGRETSREITLLLARREAVRRGDAAAENDGAADQPCANEGDPIDHPRGDPMDRGGDPIDHPGDSLRITLNEPSLNQDSPPKPPLPSGGEAAGLAGEAMARWSEFADAWDDPIPKIDLAMREWRRLSPALREQAIVAASGYVVWLRGLPKSQRRPVAAHALLRQPASWDRYRRYAPGAAAAQPSGSYPIDSREARALRHLCAVARTTPLERGERVIWRAEVTPQILTLADAPERAHWPWIEDVRQIAAWSDFLRATMPNGFGALVQTRGMGASTRRGIEAPWPWPPRKDGTVATGPPDTLLSEQDMADVADMR